MYKKWEDIEQELDIDEEDEIMIEFEMDLIRTMVKLRENQGLSQKKLAELCGMKQPTLAKIEKRKHSPQVNSLLKVLRPLGYTLQIVPIKGK
ncbi:MAG: helix-turn-helix transcriptional regulator [Lachnospiraceae bacterium]|nr:helix-turn-helix transcriptional regulator [Lachnospiraceae bacterium]MDD3616748.1 helix-turn-helix transcriptional regulator [Lachnospiraceae bacterium]